MHVVGRGYGPRALVTPPQKKIVGIGFLFFSKCCLPGCGGVCGEQNPIRFNSTDFYDFKR